MGSNRWWILLHLIKMQISHKLKNTKPANVQIYSYSGQMDKFSLGAMPFRPHFPRNMTEVKVDMFSDVTMRCTARADPQPVYEWSRKVGRN